MYAARSDSLRQNIWTDPWDGKQKVMERRQPQVRADLLPPGVTAGADGKWTYVPGVKLDQGRIRAAAAAHGSGYGGAKAETQATVQVTVGCLVRIKKEASNGWNGVLIRVETVERSGAITGSVESPGCSTVFGPDHFKNHPNNSGWGFALDHYDLVEAARPKELKVGARVRVRDTCWYKEAHGKEGIVLKIHDPTNVDIQIAGEKWTLLPASLEPL